MLSIAPKGRDLLAKAYPASAEIYRQLEADYGVERLAELIEMLIDLADLAVGVPGGEE